MYKVIRIRSDNFCTLTFYHWIIFYIILLLYAVFFSVSQSGNRKNADYSITLPTTNTRKKRNRTWCGTVVSQSFSPFARSASRGFRESLPRPHFDPPHRHIYTLLPGRMRRSSRTLQLAHTYYYRYI